MNKYYNNNSFMGRIEDKDCKYYYNKLKEFRKSNNVEDDINSINNILGYKDEIEVTDKFWEHVFDQADDNNYNGGIKLVIGNDTSTYTESNIAKTLESMGSLILASAPKDKEQDKITIFSNKQLFKKALKEQGNINSPSLKDTILVLKPDKNYKLEKKYSNLDDKEITKLVNKYKDKVPIVLDYYKAYKQLIETKNKLSQLKKEGKITPPQQKKLSGICNLIYGYKVDIIDVIEQQIQPIRFKAPLPDRGCPSWDMFDELDKVELKPLLQIHRDFIIDDDLSYIIEYLNLVVSKCQFTNYQKQILNLYRDGHSQVEISNLLKITPAAVHHRLKSILTIIYNKMYDNYEDWYYLNVVKGEYKKCKQCDEIKLISKFTKYKGSCKECRNKK